MPQTKTFPILFPPCEHCNAYMATVYACPIEFDGYGEPYETEDETAFLCEGCASDGKGSPTGQWDWRQLEESDIS